MTPALGGIGNATHAFTGMRIDSFPDRMRVAKSCVGIESHRAGVEKEEGMKNLAYILTQFGEIIRVQVEVEGMKALNKEREMKGLALAYNEKAFFDMAEDIRGYISAIQQVI